MRYEFLVQDFQFSLKELVAVNLRLCRVFFPKLCKIGLLCWELWETKHTNQ